MESLYPGGDRWQEIAAALSQGAREIHLQGLTPGAAAYVLIQIYQKLGRPFLLITPEISSQETFLKDLDFFYGWQGGKVAQPWPRILSFPAYELLPFRALSADAEVSCARVGAAHVALTQGEPFFLAAPGVDLRAQLPPPAVLREAWTYVLAGEELDRQAFLERLAAGGYERRPLVEERGEFSLRGGIIDLFPPLYGQPVRLEFLGDEVETLRFFDPATQRSQGSLEELIVLPAHEVVFTSGVKDRALAGRSRRQDPPFWHYGQAG